MNLCSKIITMKEISPSQWLWEENAFSNRIIPVFQLDKAVNFFTVAIAASMHASKFDSVAKPSPVRTSKGCSFSTT